MSGGVSCMAPWCGIDGKYGNPGVCNRPGGHKYREPEPEPARDEEVEADFEGTFHRWRCPRCEDVQEQESDPRGSEVECNECGWKGRVVS